jgi:hypothetical protein
MNIFSSPLNPEAFNHLAAAGMLGPIAGSSSSVPSSSAPPPRLRSSYSSLDTHESQQGHSSNTPFASPSHPYQKPNHISSSLPRINGTSHNGLPNGKHFTHDRDISTHSRQGSTGKSKKNVLFLRFLTPGLDRVRRFVNIPSTFLHVFWLLL